MSAGSRRSRVRVRDYTAADDDNLKHLYQEWSTVGWLLRRQTIIRGRYIDKAHQYADCFVLVAEAQPAAAAQPAGDRGTDSSEPGRDSESKQVHGSLAGPSAAAQGSKLDSLHDIAFAIGGGTDNIIGFVR